MITDLKEDELGKSLPPGSKHYRVFVGPPQNYDLLGAMQFNLLTSLGLREHHYLLDIGCGSLRGGRLFIVYLLNGRYYGIEPEQWLIKEGMQRELGEDAIRIKQPIFSHDGEFNLTSVGQTFDFILAQSIFSHASEQQIRKCLSQAKLVMKPNCIFAATFMTGDRNYTGTEWVYPGCSTYTLEYFKGMVEQAGLACKPLSWHHPSGQTWVAIVRSDSGTNIPDPGNTERLARLENHPFVKIGLKAYRFIRRIKQPVQ